MSTRTYWDSTQGLVPCKLVSADPPTPRGLRKVRLRLTATRGLWKRGEVVEVHAHHYVFIVARRSKTGQHIVATASIDRSPTP